MIVSKRCVRACQLRIVQCSMGTHETRAIDESPKKASHTYWWLPSESMHHHSTDDAVPQSYCDSGGGSGWLAKVRMTDVESSTEARTLSLGREKSRLTPRGLVTRTRTLNRITPHVSWRMSSRETD